MPERKHSELIGSGRSLFADMRPVSERIHAERMHEDRRTVNRVHNVILRRAAGRVESCQGPHTLRDLVVGAGGIATDAQPADNLPVAVKRHPTPKEDHAASDLVNPALSAGGRQEKWIERIRLPQTPQRMTGLNQSVKPCGRERSAIVTEGVGGICLGLGDGLAARARPAKGQ